MHLNKVIGLMSGTSTDGLDIAFCEFKSASSRSYSFQLIKNKFIPYSNSLKEKLISAINLNAFELQLLNIEVGTFFAEETKKFIDSNKLIPDLISSHGHTVFHKPELGLSLQIGEPQCIANVCNLPTISNFRSKDVLLGGQGAPFVPLGDEFLFNDFDACVNLGGFANISHKWTGKRLAFDIGPLNIVLNDLCMQLGKEFDKDGVLASKGLISPGLIEKLNALPYYSKQGPKSLGREWVMEHVFPILNSFDIPVQDKIASFTHHIAHQIVKIIPEKSKVLFTGGGAKNKFLIQLLEQKNKFKVCLPSAELIDFKEALIFAFLGWLRFNNKINVLSVVTGASKDTCSGIIYLP